MGNEKHIIAQIEAYIRQGGGEYCDWYIGLAGNPIDPITEASRLHKVQNDRFAYFETVSHHIAKAVADYFLNICGTDGNITENQRNGPCRALYLYKKNVHPVACGTGISSRLICWMRNKPLRIYAADNNKAIRRLYAP